MNKRNWPVPTEASIRAAYGGYYRQNGFPLTGDYEEEFDEWLAAHDEEVRQAAQEPYSTPMPMGQNGTPPTTAQEVARLVTCPSSTTRRHLMTSETFPRFVRTDMDDGMFWQSYEEYKPGDIIHYQDRDYVVQYSWAWMEQYGLFCAELEPVIPLDKQDSKD